MPIHGYIGNVITANPTAPTVSVATGVWTTEQQLQAVAAGNWPGYEYPISRSLRFNSADSAYLNRTPGSASNRKTWTWSGWVKRCNSATTNSLFSAYVDANNFFLIQFRENADNGRFEVFNYSSAFDWRVETNALLRDPSAWYHIVVALDTTQATNSNRIKIYVNGTLQTLATTSYPTLDFQSDANNNIAHYIGQDGASGRYHNGYLTEINFVDGQALEPSSFGLNDPETGVWSPKRYTGTYGTNGFYLNFSDNSGTTSTTLGKDSSGNSNNWTPNNFSVTAGAGNDSLVDSPTSYGTDTGVGGEVRGNYATLNPISSYGTVTYANGNLDTSSMGSGACARGTMAVSSGKWYWEVTINTSNTSMVGAIDVTASVSSQAGYSSNSASYLNNGTIKNNGSNVGTSYATFTTNDVIGIALDMDTPSIKFYKNNSLQATITTNISGSWIPQLIDWNTGGSGFSINFGQRAFAYTAPSGFKALCTTNLPTPTIGATSTTQANDYMNVVLYTGNSSGASVTGVGFQPDFIWTKSRSNVTNHELIDIVRGGSSTLFSNLTNAEATQQRISAFGSDGWTYTTNSNSANTGYTYVGWNWKANGAGSSNTDGTITSTVSANTTSGFSIVTYTGNDTSNSTVGHGLGVAPSMIIVKERSQVRDWSVYHISTGNTGGTLLNTTGAVNNTRSGWWSNTSPSASVFTLGGNPQNDWYQTNQTGQTYVAYCFAPVAGYSAFGSYVGNGSTDGPFVYLGFRPRFLLLKISSTTGDWAIYDTSRNTYNVMDLYLYPNSSAAEGGSGTPRVDALSNGFKLRNSGQDNTSSATYIYMAFAETPFRYSLAR